MKKAEIADRQYPIGKFEYGQKYKIDDTRKHIRYLSRFPEELKKTVKKLDREELDTPYRKGGWTVRQVVHHLADSHINAYVRTKLAVTEQTPIIKPYEEQLWAETEDGKRGSVKTSLKLIAALHRRWMEFLESLSEDDLERGYFHPSSGRVVLMQEVIALYVWHSQHHLAHIQLVADGGAEKTAKPVKVEKAKAEKAASVKDEAPAAKRGTPVNTSRSNIKRAAAPPTDEVSAGKKRVRRTKAQLAADQAGEAAAKEAKAAAKAAKQAAAAAEKAAKPPVDRAAIMAKARAARASNTIAPPAAAPKEKKSAAKSSKSTQTAESGKRVRRTQDQIAADKAAEAAAKAAAKASVKAAKATAAAAQKAAEKATKPPVDRAAIMAKARAARQANLAAASGNVAVAPAEKAPAKPAKAAAKKPAETSDKPPVDRAAIMAKARAARQVNLAAAAATEAQQAKPTAPKEKKAPAKPAQAAPAVDPNKRVRRTQEQIVADKAAAVEAKAAAKVEKKAAAKAAKKSGDAPKRPGMSADHMARIREGRMAKRAADIAAGLIPPPKPKVERDPNAPKLTRAEILEKARASRKANIVAKKAGADKA